MMTGKEDKKKPEFVLQSSVVGSAIENLQRHLLCLAVPLYLEI